VQADRLLSCRSWSVPSSGGRPDVSADAIVGFDHRSDEFNLNERGVDADLRGRCAVAWNEKYGGFWYVSSYAAVEQVARDGDTFAHKYEPDAADGVNYQGEMGVPRPEGQPPLGIGEVDGPYHLALRRALTPFFSAGAIEKMRPFMEQSVHWFLDQRIADGRMDLVLDYASPSEPTKWCSTGHPIATSRSGSVLTAASVPRWRGSCSR
jgi:cytochrome P450